MAINYLQGQPWSKWTRDERYFCSILFEKAKNNPAKFASWLSEVTSISLPVTDNWDVGFEVSFYRDFLWQQGLKSVDYGVSDQRAFDLCLFSPEVIVVIEAKAFEPFNMSQNKVFDLEKKNLAKLPGLENIQVHLVGLASSRYFRNQKEFGDEKMLKMFDGFFTWNQAAEFYDDKLLAQADNTYKMKPTMEKS